MLRTLSLSLVVGAVSTACSSSDSVTNSSAGTIGGGEFSVPYAAVLYSSDPQDIEGQAIVVLFSSVSDICTYLKASEVPKNSTFGQMVFQRVVDGNFVLPTSPASFSVGQPNPRLPSDSNYVTFGAGQLSGETACFSAADALMFAGAGTVVITDLGGRTSPTQGSYNAVFGGNNTLQGTFTAQPCIVPDAVYASNEPPTCK